ncbi:MAG: hypothetical protein PHX08_00655 [Lachnospiraceae bacterium]|nr:hypothetical protein [Lachnospiraceae bacterium]
MRSFKKIIMVIVFVSICVASSELLTIALVPDTIARVDLHNIRTKEYDDIFVGTSHGLNAINPEIIDRKTGRKSTNLCLPNEFLVDSYYLIKETCRTKKPSRVIYQLDPSYWCTSENTGENAVYIYNQYPFSDVKVKYFKAKIMELDFRTVLTPWIYYRNCYRSGVQTIKNKITNDYKNYGVNALNDEQRYFTKEGFVYQKPLEVTGEPDIVFWDESKLQERERYYFDKIVNFCKKEGIELVIISTPIPSVTLEKYQKQFTKADTYFANLAQEYDLKYYNFDKLSEKEFDKSITGYVDFEGHMSGELGNKFSMMLGTYLKK